MRLSLPAVLLAGCTAALLLQPLASVTFASVTSTATASTATASTATADPPGARRRTAAGDGSTTSLPLTAGNGLAPRTTRPFELLGVDWDGPAAAMDGAVVRVRTRDAATGRWSEWHTLETDAEDGPDRAPHGATAPLWTGRSDGVAVELRPGPSGAPPGLRLELVDPGGGAAAGPSVRTLPADPAPTGPTPTGPAPTGPAPTGPVPTGPAPTGPAPTGPGTTGPGPVDPAPVVVHQAPRPAIVTRAGWGADESLREKTFEYTGPVREVFVHHTATATGYACSDAPRVVRAIYQYHVQTNGWRDIGYNFLVDRCGTIYEGRAGGVGQPVHGAHTLGFNTDSSGVAAIGTYVKDAPPQAMLDALAALAAWKLGLTGRPADGRTRLTSGSDASRYPKGTVVDFDAVSGHRDAFRTECPGAALYARLPDLRTAAARRQPR
ncbi:peptidoglycan recognition protein [Kitasatospora sp. SUK 42]|uniref:peptidoglycan recognition protein family protein n=1 Tax=Kitasatospora sp. SUK 42 TaxID=1588882 RepID=UPI001C3162D8|nr:peptidoglycan recognition protein [Kitasatospora sp. SUK 42]MBV2154253.1 peptidoglycan recognition protein [Kitasatospora sp. SUK 42]